MPTLPSHMRSYLLPCQALLSDGVSQFFTLLVARFSKIFERRQRGLGLLHGIGFTEHR